MKIQTDQQHRWCTEISMSHQVDIHSLTSFQWKSLILRNSYHVVLSYSFTIPVLGIHIECFEQTLSICLIVIGRYQCSTYKAEEG